MHPIDFYIRELLFEFDCVTIPGLGGFITQARPARLLRDRRRIYPPSRMVSFNALLFNDDGLLANAIARQERISYREAVRKVEEFSSVCKKKLNEGRQFTIEGIGIISRNPERNLIFQPFPDANLSASNYGLDSIFVHPFITETPQGNRSTERKDRKPGAVRKKSPAPVKWTIALALPVIIFLLYGIIFPGSFQQCYTSYSGIATDLFKGIRKETPVKETLPRPGTFIPETNEIPEPLVIIPAETEAPAVEPPAKSTVQAHTGSKYYIIGGCFANESNAYNFLDFLKNRGFDAEVAGTTNHGHLRISYKSFPVKQDALVYLYEIRKQENPSAWLLKY